MVLQGTVQPGHIPVNNYELIVVGLPPMVFTKISGFETVNESVELPDRTRASGGNRKPVEFTGMSFEHHTAERAALEFWFQEGKDPVSPTYKKVGTLIKRDIHGRVASTNSILGLWITKKKAPDLDLANDGEPALIEWTFSADSVQPI
jgi:hypothetical protein